MLDQLRSHASGLASRVADGVLSVPGHVVDGVSGVPGRITGLFRRDHSAASTTDLAPSGGVEGSAPAASAAAVGEVPSSPVADPALCDASVVLAPTPAPAPPPEPSQIELAVAAFMGLYARVDLAVFSEVERQRIFLINVAHFYKDHCGATGGHFGRRMDQTRILQLPCAEVTALYTEVLAHAGHGNATEKSIHDVASVLRLDPLDIVHPCMWECLPAPALPASTVFSECMDTSLQETPEGLKVVLNPMSSDPQVRLLTGYTGKLRFPLKFTVVDRALGLFPDDHRAQDPSLCFVGHKVFRWANDGSIAIWDLSLASNTPVHTLRGCFHVSLVDSHANGVCLINCYDNGDVLIYQIESGQSQTLRGQYVIPHGSSGRVQQVAFSRDGTRVTTIAWLKDQPDKVWDAVSGEFLFDLPVGTLQVLPLDGSRAFVWVKEFLYSDDRNYHASIYQGYVLDLRAAGAPRVRVYIGSERLRIERTFSDGRHFILDDYLYDAATAQRLRSIPGPMGNLSACIPLPSGDVLIQNRVALSHYRDHLEVACVWNPTTDKTRGIVTVYHVQSAHDLRFSSTLSPDKTKLVVLSSRRDGEIGSYRYFSQICIYDVASGVPIYGAQRVLTQQSYEAFRPLGVKIIFSADGNSFYEIGTCQGNGETPVHVYRLRGASTLPPGVEPMEECEDVDEPLLRRRGPLKLT